MRISSLSIEGFGLFHDTSLPDLPPGLIVFQGENEAGKSTLLGFIRQILFNFPRRNSSEESDYPPLAGGRHGGRLGVVTSSGKEYSIERFRQARGVDVNVYGPDGSEGGEAPADTSLGTRCQIPI